MRAPPILLPALLLASLLAGCSGGGSGSQSVRSVYGSDVERFADLAPNGTVVEGDLADLLLIHGSHLEGRIGNGTWAANTTMAHAQSVAGPVMDAPAPSGGGGESTVLMPAELTAMVRIPEGGRLGGYRVGWIVGEADATGMAGSFDAVGHPADPLNVTVGYGVTEVHAFLYKGEPDPAMVPAAVFVQPARFAVTADFTITGEVQPVNPDVTGAAPPAPTGGRDVMVDKYTFELASGAEVTATTVFAGMAGDGTDVDLGLVDAGGAGLVCSASGAGAVSNLVPDPAQATESFTKEVGAGAYSVEVGFMPAPCPDTQGNDQTGFFYTNQAPVPYMLTIHIG